MSASGVLRFDTDQIAAISRATLAHQEQWDQIWNRVRSSLSATAATALSREAAGSLEARTAAYHRATARYNAELRARAGSLARIGSTAAEYNALMARVIRG